MPVYDIHSRRAQRAEGADPEVYQYDNFSEEFRTQIKFILEGAIGDYYVPSAYGMRRAPPHNNAGWNHIRHVLCREWGRQSLVNASGKEDLTGFLYQCDQTSEMIDLLDLAFRYIDGPIRRIPEGYERRQKGIRQSAGDAIEELNIRFREAAIGYQFEGGQIIRVDSQYVHAEVTIPALTLLADPRFAGPQEEFLSAHTHYRVGEHRDAVTDANNAFESTMKTICEIKGWDYPNGATASVLLRTLRDNGLLPNYLDNAFDQLAATLQSGLPQVRNEEGAHGQGSEPRETPDYVAAYALHLAAAKIVFMVEAMKETE